ncbi:MAG: formate--tetrahydrofolate ligase [Akkermansiaceae bacterium]|nr:formate--tetrahydrofolate ligase [Akkermansiaceae bacterium]
MRGGMMQRMAATGTLMTLEQLAAKLGLEDEWLIPYGRDKAKVSLDALRHRPRRGKLILVSALTPTPAGEGKTTVSIGLAQGLQALGKKTCLALREPSMGPVFGRKGGATGGGASSLTPGESINLCFNGDFPAITAANNLLSAVLDNALFYKTTRLDASKVTWKRVMDMNDRALRQIIVGVNHNGVVREDGFNITPASEVMACLCLAEDREDLRRRLNQIVVGFTPEDEAVYASEFGITDSMLAILREAINPNLVQSLEGVPAFVHGGPFANIAHGCNSVIATKMALACADYAVTEAGFAFDLGAEKFLDIKCRQSGLAPDAIVIVATIRALKMHGGVDKKNLDPADPDAVRRGLANLEAHLDSARQYKRPVLVALNLFEGLDTPEEIAAVQTRCAELGIPCAVANVFGQGGEGARELAEQVVSAIDTSHPEPFCPLYSLDIPVEERMRTIARRIYGAADVKLTPAAKKKLALMEKNGLTRLPICMAKTQNSLSDNAALLGRPENFTITVRDFEISNGAGFLVALCGDIMRMPALPKTPAACAIRVDAEGRISGMKG